jgi:EmrB/QacA subfamily drug resistance transporter
VFVALPSIGADLGFSEQGLQWVVSAYALTFGGLLLLGGRAADLLGRRRVFMVRVALFTAASLLCGLAWAPASLLAARALQGVGAAIMTPTALSIISTTFPEGAERNKALRIWVSLGGLGATAGWLIGGPLVDGPGWEAIFLINIPIGLGALALSPALLHHSRGALDRRSYDPVGAMTITGALVLLVYALVATPEVGWGAAQTILAFARSALLLAAFVAIESRHPAPLVPLRLLRSRTLVGANLVLLLFGTVAFGMPYVLTLYAQQVLGLSAVEFGAGTTVLAVMATASAIAAQAAVLKLGFRKVAATGMALIGAGSLLLTQVSAGGSYFEDIFFGLLVFGAGIGPAFVTATVAALAGVAEHESGLASGLSNTALQIGQAIGVAITTTVAVSTSENYAADNHAANPLLVLTEGFQSAFWPASCGPRSASRSRSSYWDGRGQHRTSGWSRSRRPAPRTERDSREGPMERGSLIDNARRSRERRERPDWESRWTTNSGAARSAAPAGRAGPPETPAQPARASVMTRPASRGMTCPASTSQRTVSASVSRSGRGSHAQRG